MLRYKIPTLYHLSKQNNPKELTPTIPVKSTNTFENSTIPRISFAESINGCIISLQPHESDFINNKIQYHVYNPILTNKTKILSNNKLNKKHYVFDSHITKEWWILNPIQIIQIGTIEISEYPFKTINYKPLIIGDKNYLNKNNTLTTYLYPFKWIN